MATTATKDLLEQQSMGAMAYAYPTGDLIFVDSVNGNDGNDGLNKRHALKTLVQAISKASAGDTIILDVSGSEGTVTATVAVNKAGLKIICPVANPQSGYEITAAGGLDIVTVSAADCHLYGLRLERTAAAGGTTAGVLTTAAADRLAVEKCAFDYTALTGTYSNYGVEVTDDLDDLLVKDCIFLDCHRGVLFEIATAKNCARPVIDGCRFLVGRATAFGIFTTLAGTGTVRAPVVKGCEFVEANGTGAAAASAWDGSNGADATVGPIKFDAAVDQYLIADCRAYTALNRTFENIQAINAGSTGDIINSKTAGGIGDLTAISSDTTHIESDAARIESKAVQIYSDTTIVVSDTTLATSDTAHIESDAVRIESHVIILKSDSIIVESSVQKAESDAAHVESDAVRIESHVIILKSDSIITESNTVHIESDVIRVESMAVVVKSDTTKIESDSAVVETAVLRAGTPTGKSGTIADNAIPNNAQQAGGLLVTATGGDIMITEVVLQKDGTALTGPTNLELSTNNTYGPTGAGGPMLVEAITSLGGNGYVGLTEYNTEKIPFVLDSTKALYVHGDDAAGTSAGNVKWAVGGYALAAGATLT